MPENETIFYRRDLPHIHPKDAIFFITFRLAGSLPIGVQQRLQEERERELMQLRKEYSGKEFDQEKYKVEKRHFGRLDEWLDRASTGPHWLKGSTSRFCNLALNRTGAFWHKESYDHYVRDDEALYRVVEYILNNPVKAGLVKHWQEWKFSYVNVTHHS